MSYDYLYKYLPAPDDELVRDIREDLQNNPEAYEMSKEDILREGWGRLDEDGKDMLNYRYGRGDEILGENNPNWKGGKLGRPCGWRLYPHLAGTYGTGIPRPDMEGENGLNAKLYTCPNCGKGPMAKGPFGTHKRLSLSCSEYYSQHT